MAVFLYIPPNLLLLVYPTSLYRIVCQKLKPRWRIGIKTYVETFQSCYKDGINGGHDYRSLSALVASLGFITLVVQGIAVTALACTHSYTVNNAIPPYVTIIFLSMLTIVIQPYKKKIANVSAVALLVITIMLFSMSPGLYFPEGADCARVMVTTLMLVPHCVLVLYAVKKLLGRYNGSRVDGERERLVGEINEAMMSPSVFVDTTSHEIA